MLQTAGIKHLGLNQALHLCQQGFGLIGQGLGPRCGDDASSRFHKQLVAHNGPQPVQLVAHSGLGHVHPLRRLGHRAQLHQRYQELEQTAIQVQMIDIFHEINY